MYKVSLLLPQRLCQNGPGKGSLTLSCPENSPVQSAASLQHSKGGMAGSGPCFPSLCILEKAVPVQGSRLRASVGRSAGAVQAASASRMHDPCDCCIAVRLIW